jgi:hypothetical protein
MTKDQEKFTHPWIVQLYRLCRKAFGTEEFELDTKPSEPKIFLAGMQINMTNGVIPERSIRERRRSETNINPGYINSGFKSS